MADALIEAAQLAQPPVAQYASQKHTGNRRTLSTPWHLVCFQPTIIANAGVLLTAVPCAIFQVVQALTRMTSCVQATLAMRLATFAHDVVIYLALAAHPQCANPTLNKVMMTRVERADMALAWFTSCALNLVELLQLVTCFFAGHSGIGYRPCCGRVWMTWILLPIFEPNLDCLWGEMSKTEDELDDALLAEAVVAEGLVPAMNGSGRERCQL